MSKIAVVTGGAGFIGSHLTELLLASDYKVYVIDNLSNSSLSNLDSVSSSSTLDVIEQDISITGGWLKILNEADEIYHLAGLAAIVPSIDNPRQYFLSNVVGTLNVLEASRADCRFVYYDLLSYVADAFHGEVPGLVWPDEDSRSPWTAIWGLRHFNQGGIDDCP